VTFYLFHCAIVQDEECAGCMWAS